MKKSKLLKLNLNTDVLTTSKKSDHFAEEIHFVCEIVSDSSHSNQVKGYVYEWNSLSSGYIKSSSPAWYNSSMFTSSVIQDETYYLNTGDYQWYQCDVDHVNG